MSMKRHFIFGVPVDDVTTSEAARRMEEMLTGISRHTVYYANAETLVRASRDTSFQKHLGSASLVFPDGIGLYLFGRFAGASVRSRIAGTDLLAALFDRLQKHRRRPNVFLLGGKKTVVRNANAALKKRFPGIAFVGYRDGFAGLLGWRNDTALASADNVLVGLGSPKQEAWIHTNAKHLPRARIVMAVGGAFDMFAGSLPRAPRALRMSGLEWLWRLTLEPHERMGRIWNAVVVFPFLMVKLSLGFKKT